MRAPTPSEERLLEKPAALIAYLSSQVSGHYCESGTYRVAHLRRVFEAACIDTPDPLRDTREQDYVISNFKLASVIMQAAKNNDFGPIDCARLWLRMHMPEL